MQWARTSALVTGAILGALATTAPAFAQTVQANLAQASGAAAGSVSITDLGEDLVLVSMGLRDVPPGFHGFHIHETGSCVGPAFTSAGGHLNPAGAAHPGHAGDLPLAYVAGDGRASAVFLTDRVRLAQLLDADGSAIVVHAAPDNYANIPTDRYDPDPDATTLGTGDAGSRLACGVLTSAETTFPEFPLPTARADLVRGDGRRAGWVTVGPLGGKTLVAGLLQRLAGGFHGFHVHETGSCVRPSFTSAGGHFNPGGASHPGHAGDLPAAYLTGDRLAFSVFDTDRFRVRDLLDADGSAIVVHAAPDNYANIPTDRYDPDPDATTLGTGDAGSRIACGVLRRLTRCTVTLRPNRLRAGVRTRVSATVRIAGRRPLDTQLVTLRGPGVRATRETGARGRISARVRPRAAGRLTATVRRGGESLGCSTTRRILPRPGTAGAATGLTGRELH